MFDDRFLADCARCVGLCCVALSFDRSALFGFDKPAGAPCPHLGPDHRCGIHGSLAQQGFSGCAGYDCAGAGPATTRLFAGRSWQDHPALLTPMLETFRVLREVAGRLPLSPAQAEARSALLSALCPPEGWSVDACARFDVSPCRADARRFFAALKSGSPSREHVLVQIRLA
jgi:hypothetical protein